MTKRKIPKNYSNITGKIGTKKCYDGILSYESKLERDFYFLFDYLPNIVEIDTQPVTIEYEYQNKTYKYTPDCYLLTDEGQKILAEIKYHDDLFKKFKELEPKFRAAIQYCRSKTNTKFKIFTDRCHFIKNDDLLWNIKFLSEYKTSKEKDAEIILSNFKHLDTVDELLNKISSDKFEQAFIVPTLWHMVRGGILKTDLNIRLSLKTVLERAK
jgi:hypothetical protein